MSALSYPTTPLSAREVDYPAIQAMHAASSLQTGDEARAWRGAPSRTRAARESGPLIAVEGLWPDMQSRDPLDVVIRRRGSTRRFSGASIGRAQLGTLLDRAQAAIPADFLTSAVPTLCQVYLIVNAVEGLRSGTYVAHQSSGGVALELLRAGAFQQHAGALALGQALGAEAAVNVYFLADLESVYAQFGDRGYRAAQLEAAIRAGRLYLGAYTLRLGATGLTFFDDAVTAFFSPHAAGQGVLFLLALGHPLRRGTDTT